MMASVSGSFRRKVVPCPGTSLDADGGLQAMQNALHYVHANAAAGNFGDLFGGAEAGAEDEIESLGFGQPGGFFRSRQA